MMGCRIAAGTHLLLKARGQAPERECVIEQRLRNREWRLRDVATDQAFALREAELLDMWTEGEMRFLAPRPHGSRRRREIIDPVVAELSALDDDDPKKQGKLAKLRAETIRKFRYVSEVCWRGITTLNEKHLRPVIEEVGAVVGGRRPSAQTLRRWVLRYLDNGEELWALVPRTTKRGNREPKFGYGTRFVESEGGKRRFPKSAKEQAAVVDRIVQRCIDDIYMTEEQRTITEVWEEVDSRIARHNKHYPEDELVVPDESSVARAVGRRSQYDRDRARRGQREADLRHRVCGSGERPRRPYQVLEVDSTTLDLIVVDPRTGLPFGRPTLHLGVCKTTKMVGGYHLDFNDTGASALMQCLRHAIMPKGYVKKRYPEIKNEWPCVGLPEVVVLDNALAHHGKTLEDVSYELGFALEFSKIASPWEKGGIERKVRSLNTRVIHRMPGTTFSHLFEHKGYDPVKTALISLETLHEILHVYFLDIYHQIRHTGMGDVPHRLWNELCNGNNGNPPVLPPDVSKLNVLVGKVEWRKITNRGIEIDGLIYKGEGLNAIRSRYLGPEGGMTKKVKIKVDTEDLSVIHVLDEIRGEYIKAFAEDQEYTKGLTHFQHEVFRKRAAEQAEDYVKPEDLREARRYITRLIREEFANSPKMLGNKIAKFTGAARKADPRYDEIEEVATPAEDFSPGPELGPGLEDDEIVPTVGEPTQAGADAPQEGPGAESPAAPWNVERVYADRDDYAIEYD